MIQVYGLGQCALDHLALVPSYPEADTKCEFKDMIVQGGGPVATALVALSRWGISCAIAGVIGDDAFGGEIRRSLDEERVDTTGLVDRKSVVEGKSVDLGGRRIIKKKKSSRLSAGNALRCRGAGRPDQVRASPPRSAARVRFGRFERVPQATCVGPFLFFFSSRRRHTRYIGDWSSDVCSSD